MRLRRVIGRSRASAAGVTWTSCTASAPWAARYSHTTVIDAAGAIYVIGGVGIGGTSSSYQDVWASTDGGADRTESRDHVKGYSRGHSVGTKGTKGY